MQGMPEKKPLRTRVYIDGYNFYYGCLKNTPYKWLDPLLLFQNHILPSALIEDGLEQNSQSTLLESPGIKFFTAKIVERVAKSTDSVSSQAKYHTALRKLHNGRIELVEGYYAINKMKVKIVDAENPDLPPRQCAEIQAWKVEEKQSDVNLALQAYHDAITKEIDHAVIVTNDTDIAPALEMIRAHTNVFIGLVVPTLDNERIPNTDLEKLSHWTRKHITEAELSACQLPRVIHGRRATTKPLSWYAQPELLKKILDLAIPIRGSQSEVFKWMGEPNEYLDNQLPIELVETKEGAERVLAYIHEWVANQQGQNN